MNTLYSTNSRSDDLTRDAVAATRRGVVKRMEDPHLTEHDRWVLRQFALFLGGIAPAPDRRAIGARAHQAGSSDGIR